MGAHNLCMLMVFLSACPRGGRGDRARVVGRRGKYVPCLWRGSCALDQTAIDCGRSTQLACSTDLISIGKFCFYSVYLIIVCMAAQAACMIEGIMLYIEIMEICGKPGCRVQNNIISQKLCSITVCV